MAKEEKLSLIWRIHNATCPAWLLGVAAIVKLEPGCRSVHKILGGEWGQEPRG